MELGGVTEEMKWKDYFPSSDLGRSYWITLSATCFNLIGIFLDCCGCSGKYIHPSVKQRELLNKHSNDE